MSEAVKLQQRFPCKAPFYASVITVNYKQQENWKTNGQKMKTEKWGFYLSP